MVLDFENINVIYDIFVFLNLIFSLENVLLGGLCLDIFWIGVEF